MRAFLGIPYNAKTRISFLRGGVLLLWLICLVLGTFEKCEFPIRLIVGPLNTYVHQSTQTWIDCEEGPFHRRKTDYEIGLKLRFYSKLVIFTQIVDRDETFSWEIRSRWPRMSLDDRKADFITLHSMVKMVLPRNRFKSTALWST